MKNTKTRKIDLNSRAMWLKNSLNEGSNLVYFASGISIRNYEKLPYNNIILIDKSGDDAKCYRKKIFKLRIEVIDAIELFKMIGLKIHCFVCINEGLYEGGGIYPINSDCFLGYAMPVLADNWIHIGNKNYYRSQPAYYHFVHHWLDLPYLNREELTSDHEEYIDPKKFADRHYESASVIRLGISSHKTHSLDYKGLKVIVKHASIWNEVEKLDAAFVRFECSYQKKQIEKYHNNIYPIDFLKRNYSWTNFSYEIEEPDYKTYDVNAINSLCRESGYKRIGVVPNGSDYLKMIDQIAEDGFIQEIIFYHLNKDDYTQLYNL